MKLVTFSGGGKIEENGELGERDCACEVEIDRICFLQHTGLGRMR